MWLFLTSAAIAAEVPAASVHGDVKVFFLAGVPKPWFGFTDDAVDLFDAAGLTEAEALELYGLDAAPFSQGVASGRLKGTAAYGPVRLEAHWAFAAQSAATSTAAVGLGTGVGSTAPELFPLTWSPDVGDGLGLTHRIDRLVVAAKLPHVDLTLGRQPVSFGVGRVFTPMDLVNPFHPATIDNEYKPGVDAARVDAYVGGTGRVTAVAAWAGPPPIGDDAVQVEAPATDVLVLAATAQVTVGVTDLLVFVGDVRSEPVIGVGTASSIGPVGVHAEATVTLPTTGDPFVRGVAGAMWRPTDTTTLTGEAYAQSFGATDAGDYLAALESERVARGELWTVGQLYASVAVAQEITPVVHLSAAVIANLRDPSALCTLAAGWSVADNAELVLGLYAGLGAPPDEAEIDLTIDPATLQPTLVLPDDDALGATVNSEFGLYPTMAFLQVKTYF